MKALRIAAFGMAVIAVVVACVAIVLEVSLPYRIGPQNYEHYQWAGRLSMAALVVPFLGVVLGAVSRQRLSVVFAGGAGVVFIALSVAFVSGVHSGPNPEMWCFNDLRRIAGAKEALVRQLNLTNGTIVTADAISPLIYGGFRSLKCYEHGVYTIGPIGTEPRCSVHGSTGEMEAKWKQPAPRIP